MVWTLCKSWWIIYKKILLIFDKSLNKGIVLIDTNFDPSSCVLGMYSTRNKLHEIFET